MKERTILRLPLQYFAEGDVLPANQVPPVDSPPSYEELVKTDTALQSFLAGETQSAVRKAIADYEEKQKVLSDEKATEAQKLAKMNETEKHAYELKKAQEEIARYKLQESVRGLKEETLKTASAKGVPAMLIEFIPFEHIKAEEVNAHIDSIKTVYDTAVKEGIAKALDGAGTPRGGGGAVQPQATSFMQAITENQAKRD